MDSPYSKQFPSLMKGKKIMYVHGFLSSAQSGTVKMLQELMPSATILAEDIPVHPADAMTMLHKMADEEQPDLIIGTSMGGMYTEMLHGFDRILVNPAFAMGDTMSSMTGHQVFQNPRKDGVQELMVTKGLIKEYKDITTQCFANVDAEERKRVYGLFGDNDPVVHTFDLFQQHYPNAIYFHGEHPTNNHAFTDEVQRWAEEFFSAPAYNHLIFTNQKNLLYGDYFIDPQPNPDFMGTTIAFGSDEFKTWEEVITFFERLGGQ